MNVKKTKNMTDNLNKTANYIFGTALAIAIIAFFIWMVK
jgi:hypothetical protein